MQYIHGRLVFEEGRTKAVYIPRTGEILLPPGRPRRETLRHERAHAVYHALPEPDKKRLRDAFEQEIGYSDYIKANILNAANGGRWSHDYAYYLTKTGGIDTDLIANEFTAMLAACPKYFREEFDYAPNFKRVFEELGFHKINGTLRRLRKAEICPFKASGRT